MTWQITKVSLEGISGDVSKGGWEESTVKTYAQRLGDEASSMANATPDTWLTPTLGFKRVDNGGQVRELSFDISFDQNTQLRAAVAMLCLLKGNFNYMAPIHTKHGHTQARPVVSITGQQPPAGAAARGCTVPATLRISKDRVNCRSDVPLEKQIMNLFANVTGHATSPPAHPPQGEGPHGPSPLGPGGDGGNQAAVATQPTAQPAVAAAQPIEAAGHPMEGVQGPERMHPDLDDNAVLAVLLDVVSISCPGRRGLPGSWQNIRLHYGSNVLAAAMTSVGYLKAATAEATIELMPCSEEHTLAISLEPTVLRRGICMRNIPNSAITARKSDVAAVLRSLLQRAANILKEATGVADGVRIANLGNGTYVGPGGISEASIGQLLWVEQMPKGNLDPFTSVQLYGKGSPDVPTPLVFILEDELLVPLVLEAACDGHKHPAARLQLTAPRTHPTYVTLSLPIQSEVAGGLHTHRWGYAGPSASKSLTEGSSVYEVTAALAAGAPCTYGHVRAYRSESSNTSEALDTENKAIREALFTELAATAGAAPGDLPGDAKVAGAGKVSLATLTSKYGEYAKNNPSGPGRARNEPPPPGRDRGPRSEAHVGNNRGQGGRGAGRHSGGRHAHGRQGPPRAPHTVSGPPLINTVAGPGGEASTSAGPAKPAFAHTSAMAPQMQEQPKSRATPAEAGATAAGKREGEEFDTPTHKREGRKVAQRLIL